MLILGTYCFNHNDNFIQNDADITVNITVADGPLVVQNDFVFLKQWESTIIKIDISDINNPSSPTNVTDGELRTGDYVVYENKLFVSTPENMLVYDVTNPGSIGDPIYNWSNPDFGNIITSADYFAIVNDIAYMTENRILYIFDFSDLSNLTYLNSSNLDICSNDFTYNNGYLYFPLEQENPIDESSCYYFGLVDVSNPSVLNPMITLENDSISGSCDVEVKGNYAYLTVNDFDNHRCFLTVVDVSNKTQPEKVTSVELGADYVHHITINENTIYIGLDDEGLAVIDISDPDNPSEPIYNRFNRFPCDVRYVLVHNDYLLFTYNPGLGIIALSEASKSNLATIFYPLIIITGLIFPVVIKRKR
ncbi:MAG: hypothetical protein HZR80_08140 [Candidatus Heimdallarchaeota archaeon]